MNGASVLRRTGSIARAASAALACVLILAVLVIGYGLSQGYRPVVITTGSMDPTAPPGSLLVAGPTNVVHPGDVLVMSRQGRATITHRIVDLEPNAAGQMYAVTRGDANPDVDPAPYLIGTRELTGRWVVPRVGRLVLALGSPRIGVGVIGVAVLALSASALGRIWRTGPSPAAGDEPTGAGRRERNGPTDRPQRQRNTLRRRVVAVNTFGAVLAFAGTAASLYLGVDSVGGNTFSTAACFDARLSGVQSGQAVSVADGSQTVAISAVDPAASFLMFSVRSDSGEPADSQVMGRLVDATSIEFVRQTDASTPGPVVVEWSVVEYGCGVTVQRGVLPGDGTTRIDVPITPVGPGSTFVTTSSAPQATAGTNGSGDLQIAELVGGDTLRIRTGGGALEIGRQIGWQVITFDDPGDAEVQVVSATLAPGSSVATISLPSPVDPGSSFVLAATASPSSNPAIGDRLVRARLVDPTTVEVARFASGAAVEVNVQVVELLDGSTVRSGVLDLSPAQTTKSVTIPAVDAGRTSAFSTLMVPGSASGGATDQVGDDIVGEGSVTVTVTDASTITVERTASASSASFAWQAVTWGGPRWADLASPFRQRIDVTGGVVDAPDGYTTSLTFDHLALVDAGLALPSGDDVRIWRHDGLAWSQLDRVLDDDSSWNAADTTIWFRTREPVAAGQTVTYWMYFGDPAPPPPWDDPDQVWLLREGFEDGTLGVFEDRTGGSGWYRALPWTRRATVTVPAGAVDSDLTGQPVLVRVTDPDLGANAQPDASDIRFTASDGFTGLAHEVETFDSATGTLTAWVRVPMVSSVTDTTLYLYYGAADAPAQARPRQVWLDDLAVWNLARDPAGPAPTLDDSGNGNHDGLALGDAVLVAGPSGSAVALDGAVDRLESAPFDLPDRPLTIAAWFRADALGVDPVVVAQGDPATSGVFELAIDTTTVPGSPTARVRLRTGGSFAEISAGAITVGGWHHLAAVWDGSLLTLYLDGAAVGSVPAAGTLPDGSSMPVVIGGDPAGSRTLEGLVDQVRIGSGAWSPSRVSFVARQLTDPAATATVSAASVGTWFDQGDWSFRRPLTVDASKVAGPLTDYPLLVQLSDPQLGSGAQADGDDLVFVAADGVTRLDHQIESWDPGTGTLTAWVRMPVLDAATNRLFLYLGNAGAVDQTDPIGVWGPDADLVLTN